MAQSKIIQMCSSVMKRCSSTISKSQVIAPLQELALAERCIVVDDLDNRIGSASKYDCHRIQPDGSLTLHRAFSVFLFNSKGEILLQKRSPTKVTFPSHVSNACCSHPVEDFPVELIEEDARGVKEAAIRRLNYELGIPKSELTVNDFKYLTRIHYKANDDKVWGEHEIDYILFLQKEISLKPNPEEVSNVAYVSQKSFDKYLQNLDDPLTPWFRLIIKTCLPQWWSNLSNLQEFQNHKEIQKL